MSDFSSFFENLYSQFLMRDLFAKITPGALVIFSTAWFYFASLKQTIEFFAKFPFLMYVLVLSLAWILGIALQGVGFLTHFLSSRASTTTQSPEDIARFYEEMLKIISSPIPNANKIEERLVVIKEACGIASIAFIYSGILLTIHLILLLLRHFHFILHIHRMNYFYRLSHPMSLSIISACLALVLIFAAAYILREFHIEHVKRQENFHKAFIALTQSQSKKIIESEEI